MKLLISACLLGTCCRYDGASKAHPLAAALAERHTLVPVCPEQLGGLPTPRPPAERRDGRVATQSGDVTEQYRRGAEETLKLCKLFGCEVAVLKERSPSCGHGQVYDGTFSGAKCPGDGVTAALFKANGIRVFGESQLQELINQMRWDDEHDSV